MTSPIAGTDPHSRRPRELFNVLTPPDALRRLLEQFARQTGRSEHIATADALDRVLAEDLVSPSDLPSFPRSTMDGFAVRAADTYGASEGLPAYLTVVGEVLMGRAPVVTARRRPGCTHRHRWNGAARRRRRGDDRAHSGSLRCAHRGSASSGRGRERYPGG